MQVNYSVVPNILRPKPVDGVFRIIVPIGGVKSSLMRYYLSCPNLLLNVIDNALEIYRLREKFRGKSFVSFVAGDGETTRTLHRNSPEAVREASLTTANASLFDGFGARADNAARAAEELVASEEFQLFLASLPDEAYIRTKGKLSHIELHLFGSDAGAACAGAKIVLAKAMLRPLLQIGLPVDCHLNLLGPMTFAGISKRARPNAAVSLLKALHFILDNSDRDFDLAAKFLEIHNLPPFQDDVEQRDSCLLSDTVAMESIQMQQYLRMVTPNLANDSETGTISSRVVDFMTGLNPLRDLAGPSAALLFSELQTTLSNIQPDPLLIKENLQWQDESTDQERQDLDKIIDSIDDLSDESLEDAIVKPPALYRFQIHMLASTGVRFWLERLSTDFAVTPQTLAEFDQRMRLIRTFQQFLNDERAIVDDERRIVTDKIANVTDRLHALLPKLRQPGASSSGRLIRNLTLVAEILRENWDRWNQLTAEQQALDRAQNATDHEWAHHHGTIETILSTLESYIPTGILEQTRSTIATQRLSSVFPLLLGLPELPRTDQIDLLCGITSSVNSRGLARCVNSSSDRLESIAHSIVFGEYTIESPSHGARLRQFISDKVIYALPPMEPELEHALARLIRQMQPKATVTFYDTLSFGAPVMRIRFQRFSHVSELFTGLVAHDLAKAMKDPRAALNSRDLSAAIQFFNARIEGDRVVFPVALCDETRSTPVAE